MPMKDLLNMKYFRLLSEPSQVSTKEIQTAYEAFVKRVTEMTQSDSDYSKVFRLLNHLHIDLDSLMALPLFESGGGYS